MAGLTIALPRPARRALLLGIAAAPALAQGLTAPRFALTYESPPRVITLSPPPGDVLSCDWSGGVILLSRDEVLGRLRARVDSSRSAPGSSPSEWWSSKLDRVLRDERARSGDCSIPRSIVAELLDQGHASVVDSSGRSHPRIAVHGVAWVHDGRPAFYSYGDGRAFTTLGSRYRPAEGGRGCGPGCVLYAGDHRTSYNGML